MNYCYFTERIIKKSYIQRIVDYIAMITGNGKIQNIYIYPDISVEQGSNTLDILSYKGTVLLKPNATKSLYTNDDIRSSSR